ncbi:hypothetical protein NBRC106471_2413 [Acetobacter pasteurianus subsp. pasteurianus LMG 1262 = NBRC 106471]|nr:hypothetical protein NBRC106471_2413 [Acetobacter pasteurianus subsp. pasteurianus LMG 1262 = NBRC 106471]
MDIGFNRFGNAYVAAGCYSFLQWHDPKKECSEMGWLPSSPHGIAMCQNGRWKKRLRERTADEGYSDRR